MLWPCEWSARETDPPDMTNPHALAATPTDDDTASGRREGRRDWREDVFEKDGRICFLTSIVDLSMPRDRRPPDAVGLPRDAAYIVKYSGNDLEAGKDSASDYEPHSLFKTTDILRSYLGDTAAAVLNDVPQLFDDPQNALLLEWYMHRKFARFEWCLLTTQVPNTYSVKWVDNAVRHWPREIAHEVTFVDRSGRCPGIALPSPLLLRCHAALAHVRYHSGILELFNAQRAGRCSRCSQRVRRCLHGVRRQP
ncbi:hypothetical protein OH76DRAFT_377100 [Lentinus brumalis]|uniref:HNH nuclease domain-containing protein n=1 Tax=Lentinus brumalis TaxID=2498619 RepID=A0A371CIV7_9APHY|nr:hypothetical protein OH76DRAFT_377100 [Polyporus brumalis]